MWTMQKTNNRAKIAIIGGGSLYCAELMSQFIANAAELQGCHITLMDINEEDLELIYAISSKLFQHAGVDLTLERTTVQEEALDDANFVLTTFRTGGLQARHLDEKIPLAHGLIGQDTIGPGGFFYALRTAPVVAGIAAEIEKVAPKAILLNYLNPSNVVTEAIAHSSGIRVIGLSDSPRLSVQMLAQRAGVVPNPPKRIVARTIGLTHGNWTTSVWYEGSDILPRIVAWCKEYINQRPAMTAENYDQIMLARLTADYEAIPSYYMHYYYFPEIVLEFLKSKPTTRAEDIMSTLPQLRAYYQEEAKKDVPHQVSIPGDHPRLGHFTLQIIRSILNDTGEEWVVSVPNNGSLNFIDDDRIVEVPCRVDARGATPLAQGDGGLAINQTGLIALLAEYEGATARAALWGTRRDAIKALASNPLVMSYSKAEQIYDALATVHAQYLPERLLK
jgi:6-phospho-beta-glucosidase